ncbi:MAG: periplasmic heavy metal sensor [Acidobacteria bacterium]|nr:periplasmic heavy metal sensor [Acidobacteriota bacterium]
MQSLAKTIFRCAFLFLAGFVVFGAVTLAQDETKDDEPDAPPAQQRPNLTRALGLRPDQVQQFRRFNQAWQPKRQEAAMQLRLANRELDAAIYADNLDEDLVKVKLSAFHEAQKEVAKLRFEEELAIRKILDPEQLQRFRELRRRFAENRQQRQLRRQQNPNAPLRRNSPGQRREPGERPPQRPAR